MGGNLPTYWLRTRNREAMAAWFVMMLQRLHIRAAVASRFLFRADRQVTFVTTKLEGLERTCCHGTIGLATGRDRCCVTNTGWYNILSEPYLHRIAVPTFADETIFLDREDFGAASVLGP